MEHFNPKIELYQQRQFGDKLNATFTFLRQEARPYFKAQLIISGPVAIICAVLYSMVFSTLMADLGQVGQPGYVFSYSYFFNFFGTLIFTYLLLMVVALVNYAYMRLYHDKGLESPSVGEVWELVKRKLLPTIGLMIIMSVLIMAGFFCLIIPGIYIMGVSFLTIPILVNDEVGVFGTVGRAFRLIGGKWWSTFGIALVTGIIAAIIRAVISLPATILFGAETFLSLDSGTFEPATAFSPWTLALSSLLGYVGAIVGNTISQSALGFQYYNLVEMKESRGLLGQIDQVGKKEEDNANEGEY